MLIQLVEYHFRDHCNFDNDPRRYWIPLIDHPLEPVLSNRLESLFI